MSKEERAKISRENGSKSQVPKTEEGKEKSARNSIEHGLRAEKLKHFAPPHYVALCSEGRGEYYQQACQRLNLVAKSIVRDFAIARWQILRLDTCLTSHRNLALIEQGQKPLTVVPELGEIQTVARSVEALFTGDAIAHRLNRQIDQLGVRIARLQRQLRDVRQNFAATQKPAERTQQTPPQPIANTTNESKKPQNTEQPVFITENTPGVIAYYVANGIEVDDDMPDIPRKVT